MLKGHICVLLFVLCTHQSWGFFRDIEEFAADVSDVIRAAKIAEKYYKHEDSVIKSPDKQELIDDATIGKLKMIRRNAKIELDLAIDIVKRLAENMEISLFKRKLEECIVNINARFMELLYNLENPRDMNGTWNDFSVHASLEMRYKIKSFHHLLSGVSGTLQLSSRLLELLQSGAIQKRSSCGESGFELPHHLVDVVRIAFIVEIESLAVLTFIIPIISKDGESIERISQEEKDSVARRMEYLKLATETIELPPGTLRMCDPLNGSWILGQSCFEVERLVQRTIFKETSHWLKFALSCNYQADKYNGGDKDYIGFWTSGSTCNGHLAGCQGFNKFSGCVPSPADVKRFEWIKTDKGTLYGINIGSCESPNSQLEATSSSSCLCTCYENSRNFVSVEWIQSDVKKNMVITGLRFIRRRRVIYLQPKQGKLIENGGIDPETEEWVDLPMVEDTAVPLTMNCRTFFLDDLMIPLGSVVTGMRFSSASINNLEGFKIKIQGVKFHYSTGKLCNKEECVTSAESLVEDRTEVDYGRMNSIYNSKVTHAPSSGNNSFVTLHHSTLEQDFGQSTVPLLDGVPLETDPPLPLGGIGIFHKSGKDPKSDRYAGFISLRMHSLDYHNYLKEFRARYKRGKA